MKKIILLLICLLPVWTMQAQKRSVQPEYAAGAVPVVNGFVQFEKTYTAKGKSKAELMTLLQD